MSLRLKLILSFVTTSMTVVLLFAFIAYNSAHNYLNQSELKHVNDNTLRIISMLGINKSSLEQIERIIPHYEFKGLFYFIIDSNTGIIVSKELTTRQQKAADNLLKNGNIAGITQGYYSGQGEGEHYFWTSNPIPDTQYILLSMFNNKEKEVSGFLNYIDDSLAVSTFFALWLSLWAATILANLFQRLANQKTEIEYKSRHDPLTSLPNRQTIGEIIDTSIFANNNDTENLLLCLIDINGLKDVNDSLGHEYGDSLLVHVSERLQEVLRTSDKVGRFGGDKFATILTHSKNTAIEELCNRLLATFDRAFHIGGHDLYLGATLGIASYPEHAEDSQLLIQKAEIALHTAKDSSKDFFIYDSALDQGNAKRLNLANDLRQAIRNGQLELHYQPQLDLRSGKIVSVEALARWNHPEYGLIPPDTFILIAERTGQIKQFTEWVLTTAVKQCAEWRKSFQSLSVAINLSARNLHDETLVKQLSRLVRHWKIIPEQICLEITETAMMADPEHARLLLEEMDRLGLRIAIDDFGTGYSSLSYLKKLPVDEIKIDRSFVMNMGNSENDTSIIRATVGLAHDLGLSVVAEGVEDQASQDQLKQMGCEVAQGYHICKPLPAAQVIKFIEAIDSSTNQLLNEPDKDELTSQNYNQDQGLKPA